MTYVDLMDELKATALRTPAIIRAFEQTDRAGFVPERLKQYAYADEPLPIGSGQTISQPYTVAVMTEALQPQKGDKILEVGTGSGWQAAILSLIVGHSGKTVTTETVKELYETAKERLAKYKNVMVVHCDGSCGYAAEAPYERIIVTASAPDVPQPLLEQLKNGGRMVVPVGRELFAIAKDKDGRVTQEFLGYFVFVPLVGEHGHKI